MTSDAWIAILDCAAKVSGVFSSALQIGAGRTKHEFFWKIMQCQQNGQGKHKLRVRSVSQTLAGPSALHIQLQTELYDLYQFVCCSNLSPLSSQSSESRPLPGVTNDAVNLQPQTVPATHHLAPSNLCRLPPSAPLRVPRYMSYGEPLGGADSGPALSSQPRLPNC